MAEKLKIISLGGLNEIGKNLTVYEYGDDIIAVDMGMGFPDDDMYGIDVVLPDVSYLIKNQDRLRGIFLPTCTRTTSARCPMCSGTLTPPSTPPG
jgi:ribonuclease J